MKGNELQVLERLIYDPSCPTSFRWKPKNTLDPINGNYRNPLKAWNSHFANKPAGSFKKTGHAVITIGKEFVWVHRLVFALHYGEIPKDLMIDHIDGNPRNNSPSNLRLATCGQNCSNSKIRKDSTTQLKGVHKTKSGLKFEARIRHEKKLIHIGTFATEKEAHLAYCKTAQSLKKEFFKAG